MKNKYFLLVLALSLTTVMVQAQGPNNSGTYYQNANGKKGAALKTAFFNIINPHTNIGYDGLYEAYKKTDTRPDGYVRDWYSNATNYEHGKDNKGNYSKEGDMYNREHSVPQSWFGSGTPKADIVHVLPTDGYVNNRRSNNPLAEVGSVDWSSKNGYSKLGSCKTEGYSGTVFEPNDEIKGDMARIYFYMVTCYENSATGWGNVFSSSKYPGFQQWYLDMLMRWSKQDPVDQREIDRNNAVFEVQGNRNPFVDYPGLEDYVWGSKTEQAFSYDSYEGGGTIDPIQYVSQPVFDPLGGTYVDSVIVGIKTSTAGAVIYYTTDGTTPTAQSTVYSDSLTFKATTTLKAVAIKDDRSSYVTEATYTIKEKGNAESAENSVFQLSSEFFNVSYNTTVSSSASSEDFVGKQNGITVVYALGSGAQRYITSSQIRLYPGNELTFSVEVGSMVEIEFTLDDKSPKIPLQASNGSVNEMKWTGDAQSVTFTANGKKDHLRITTATVTIDAGSSGITKPAAVKVQPSVFYDLQGRRVHKPQKGLYIVEGRKVIFK